MTLEQILQLSEDEQKAYLLKSVRTVKDCYFPLSTLAIVGEWKHITTGPKGKKKTINYLNVPTSFDIETTSYKTEETKSSFMYIWQIMIDNILIIGRTWDEFIELCEKLRDIFDLSDARRLAVYVHNLSFEFQHFCHLFDSWEIFARKEREPLKAFLPSYGIEFRDSLALSGCTLQSLSSQITRHDVHKMAGDLDYTKIRTYKTNMTDKELLYCIYDVLVVNAYILEKIEDDGDITKIPMTKTGYVRKHCKNETIYNSRAGRGYSRKMKNLKLKTEEYIALRKAFAGGFTHSNPEKTNKTIPNVRHIDFTSSYPTVMIAEKFPATSGNHLTGDFKLDRILNSENYLTVCRCHFENLAAKFDGDYYLSSSKCENLKNPNVLNGRMESADSFDIWLTNVDLEIVEKCYSFDFECHEAWAYKMDYLPRQLIACIVELYENKTNFKGVEGKELEYNLSKQLLNSIYGVMVQKIENDEITFEGGQWYKTPADLAESIEKYNENKSRFNIYSWGVFITAYARRNLWLGILEAGENNYIYSDTDSIFYQSSDHFEKWIEEYNCKIIARLEKSLKNAGLNPSRVSPLKPNGTPAPLGVWDREKDCDHFKTLGAKRYLEERGGEYRSTIAGLAKDKGRKFIASQEDPFNFFADGMKIPAKSTGKLTHTYNDNMTEFAVKDIDGNYVKIKTPSGICLEPCEFHLTIEKNYLDWITKENLKWF